MHRTILFLAGLGLAQAAIAEPRDYAFDMSHSRVFFDIDHRGYSMMLGRFAEFAGTFKYDAEDPTNSSLDITIDPASIDMFHEGLNNHLKTADFFDVEQHPEMRFTSERVEVVGEDQVEEIPLPSLGGEDFASYLRYAPGALLRLGVASQLPWPLLHSPRFDLDERALRIGAQILARSAVRLGSGITEDGNAAAFRPQ